LSISGLNTEPASLIHLASDSRYRVYPQTSLLTCRLGFGQVGLATVAATHPLAGNNQFLSRTGLPRLWIYLGTTGISSILFQQQFIDISSGNYQYYQVNGSPV